VHPCYCYWLQGITRQTVYALRNIEARSRIIVAVEKQYILYICVARTCVRVPERVGVSMGVSACMFWCSLQLLSKTFFILRRIQQDIVINVETSSHKVPVIFVGFQWNLNFLDRISEKTQISSLIKLRLVEAELLHTDGRTDGHDKANSRFSKFCERV
jgi:hypothetical protein